MCAGGARAKPQVSTPDEFSALTGSHGVVEKFVLGTVRDESYRNRRSQARERVVE
jgi:hypothetical protein